MKNLILAAAFALAALSRVEAYQIFYSTTTLVGVAGAGDGHDAALYVALHPDVAVAYVVDGSSIAMASPEHLRFSLTSQRIVFRSQAAINLFKLAKRKVEIKERIKSLLLQNSAATQAAAEGLDVAVDTTTIRQQIDALKLEYQGIP